MSNFCDFCLATIIDNQHILPNCPYRSPYFMNIGEWTKADTDLIRSQSTKKRGRPKGSKNKSKTATFFEPGTTQPKGKKQVDFGFDYMGQWVKAPNEPPKHTRTFDPKEALASKKMCFDEIPITADLYLAKASLHGALKYGMYNWLELPNESMSLMTYINAIRRHWLLLKAGQDLTSDAQVHHLAAIMAGCAVALDAITFGKMKDDRIKLSPEQIETLERMINNG